MKQVSLLAPADVAAESIRKAYGGLADPQLLDAWTRDPARAPGRTVSSPWPDRIEIADVSEQRGDTASVTGAIVEATSTGDAARIPVRVKLRRENDAWLITAFDPQQPAGDGNDAVAVVKAYYDAINAHDYRRAFALWGRSGPPQTFDEFEKGFADTASVSVTTGEPSRVEGAAGSRYIDVPVTITATKKSGERQTFTGTYTLRRTVVDGAPPSERRWHLNGANIHASP